MLEDETEVAAENTQAEIESLARSTFDNGVENGQDEDQIKMDMIGVGCTFKNVTRLYNKFLVDSGITMSKEELAGAIDAVFADSDITTEEGLDAAVASLVESTREVSSRSAMSRIKSYAKKQGVAFFVKPKGEGIRLTGFHTSYHEFLLSNPDEAQARAFILGEGDNEKTSENIKRNIKRHLETWTLTNSIFNLYA
mgnify:CR=1 FL=1